MVNEIDTKVNCNGTNVSYQLTNKLLKLMMTIKENEFILNRNQLGGVVVLLNNYLQYTGTQQAISVAR